MLALFLASVLVSGVPPHQGVTNPAAKNVSQAATAGELPRGRVVARVACAHDPSQSYALYLPSTYSPDRTWPVLYAFDPRARGTVPVERFKDAAERYGWIVVASNNSRNGPFQVSVDAWNAIVEDTRARYAVDDRRVYATGFSGGARVAVYLAVNSGGSIAGVILVGAGFPGGLAPPPALRVAVFGSVGIEDFNLPEMEDLDTALAAAGTAHRLDHFPGRHEWLPSDAATDAVGWMELLAMQSGTRTRDDGMIAAIRQHTMERARAREDAKDLYEAWRLYAAAAVTGSSDTADLERRVAQLREHADVKAALRSERQQITQQRRHEALISTLVARGDPGRGRDGPVAFENEAREEPADDLFGSELRLHQLLTDLRKQSQRAEDSAERRVARRVLDGVFVSLTEQGLDFLRVRRLFARAVRTFTLATEVAPDRNSAFYYLAWAHAAAGDRKKAQQALATAIDRGFADLEAITSNQAFEAIRGDPSFQRVVQALQGRR